jgi:hypothetical protein
MNDAVNSGGTEPLRPRVANRTNGAAGIGADLNEQPTDSDSAYRLAEPDSPPVQPATAAPEPELEVPKPEIETTFQPATEPTDQTPGETFPDLPPEVSAVWTRWADWKQPLIWTAAGVALAILIVIGGRYVAIVSFVVALTYGSYRVVTSLEVPVRVTPEQAIQEFFGAAGHRLPNFDRMYALLTTDGKRCDEFRNLSEFRAYWRERIAQFTHAPIYIVPLEFHIEGFSCRYNEGKSMATVRYSIKVAPRSRQDAIKPVAELQARNLVVKGPDGQWYVNDGCLPDCATNSGPQ